MTLLVAIPQLLQAIAVGAVVMGFLVLFALIAVPAPVQAAWIGAPPRELIAFFLLDEERTLSEELVIVSAVLGGIVGLYFSALGITDPSYRVEGFDREVAGIRKILAVRAVSRGASAKPVGRAVGDDPRPDGLNSLVRRKPGALLPRQIRRRHPADRI